MLPNLKPNDDVIVWCWFFKLNKGDLIVFKKDNRLMVKRVISINSGSIMVEGDNKDQSTDSRSFGVINMPEVVGKVVAWI